MLTGDLGHAPPADWRDELTERGVPLAMIDLLGECVAGKAERRLADAGVLVQRLEALVAQPPAVEVRGAALGTSADGRSMLLGFLVCTGPVGLMFGFVVTVSLGLRGKVATSGLAAGLAGPLAVMLLVGPKAGTETSALIGATAGLIVGCLVGILASVEGCRQTASELAERANHLAELGPLPVAARSLTVDEACARYLPAPETETGEPQSSV